jgi:hypothetical protein
MRENFTQKREIHASSKSKITDLLANLTGIADAKASHMKVKVPIPFLTLAAMLFVAASFQTRAQSIIIQHSGATDPLTEGFSGFNLSGAGSSYNLYQLIYNPFLDQVGLFINGAQYGDYVPEVDQGAPYEVDFGTGDHVGTGNEQANWNLVSLSVPEPSILSLILAGGGIFIFVRICKKIILRNLFAFNRFASFSDDFFKVNVQSQSNPQQSVQRRDSLFLFDKSYRLTRQSSFLSNQVERKPAFCTLLFQETRDLRTNGFRYFAD